MSSYMPISGSQNYPDKTLPKLNHKTRKAVYVFITLMTLLSIYSLTTSSNSKQGYNGAVSSEHIICSDIGVDILKQGGSAVDSAIATSICIGTVNMHSSGIGGGGFMIIKQAGDALSINFREKAPKNAFTDMFKNNSMAAQIGGLSVAVPGELKGFWDAHVRFGVLSWDKLFKPSVDLARNGWPINNNFARKIALHEQEILDDNGLSDILAPRGVLLKLGDICKRTVYSKTLQEIGEKGIDVFYNGWIATSLVETAQKNGGIITEQDFKEYDTILQIPLVGSYRGMDIYTSPPPASGAIILSALNIIENFDNFTSLTPENAHRIAEAFKFGYAQRGYLGDPIDPIYKNISQITKSFIEKDVAYSNYLKIKDTTFDPLYYQPNFTSVDNHGTMHVSVLSRGQAVSVTSTVNLILGSRLMDAKTGIILNDEMDDFSIPGVPNAFGLSPSPYNYIHPNKRPLSSCSPTIVQRDDKIVGVLGASGGSHIISAVLISFLRMFEFNESAFDSVHLPRFHHQLIPNQIWTEYETPKNIIDGWKSRGHDVKVAAKGVTVSGVSVIKVQDGLMLSAGDSRKNGDSAAY